MSQLLHRAQWKQDTNLEASGSNSPDLAAGRRSHRPISAAAILQANPPDVLQGSSGQLQPSSSRQQRAELWAGELKSAQHTIAELRATVQVLRARLQATA